VWLLALGATLALTQGVVDPADLPAVVVAGGAAAIVALLALTVAETDEAFANAYSGAVSLQNLFPGLPQRPLVVVTTLAGTALALTIDLVSYQSFLLLLGSCFVPLFAVLLADWLVAGRAYTPDDVIAAPAWRPAAIGAWALGFATYQWLTPTGPGWWVEQVERLHPPGWAIGSTLPSFVVSLALGLAAACWARRGPSLAPPAGGRPGTAA
jgi:purine-cytosine permease-like protein